MPRHFFAAFAAVMASATMAAAQQCPEGRPRVGDLGFDRMGGSFSMEQVDDQRPRVQFSGEPVIRGVRDDGPAAGRLRDGDVITAIDGQLITTTAGGRRFSAVDPGDRVRLTVRRGGRTQDVTIVAGSRCATMPRTPAPPRPPRAPSAHPAPPAPAGPPRTPRPPSAVAPAPPAAPGAPPAAPAPAPPVPPTPPAPPAPPEIMPAGWFGFGIQCRDCGVAGAGGDAVFQFREAPRVVSVEPGTAAARAGLRRDDRLTHVDGVSLTTPAGWRRFGAIRPGQRVTWTYTRDGRSHQSAMTAVPRPDARAAPAPAHAQAQAQRLRYSGSTGGTQVEVRGAPVNITTDPATGEMVIRSADVTVRIRPERP